MRRAPENSMPSGLPTSSAASKYKVPDNLAGAAHPHGEPSSRLSCTQAPSPQTGI